MSSNKKMILGALLAASCAIVCLAMTVQAQYNTFDSDSNSDSEGGQILSNAELGKLMRGSAKVGRGSNFRNYNQQQQLAATKNLYNKQQPLQYAPTQHNRRQFSPSDLSGYNPLGAAASSGQSNANNDDDDNESENFGPNFGANYDGNEKDGEGGVQADGQPMNLNQAASGYPSQGDYNEGAGFNFAGNGGYGASADSGDYGGEGFGGDGRRAKSASSLMGRGMGDDDAGASQYGPNSAVNSGDDDEGRSGYAPEASNDNDNDNDDESLLVTGPFLRLLYSLGQGISCAAGMAFAGKRVDKADYNVFCVLGDGESAEGSVWEAFAFASTHKLDNLFAIIDVNRQSQSEPAALGHQIDVYEARCKAFGMETYNIDGHSVAELVEAFATAKASKNGKPKAIICKTLKGKGFPDIEDLKEDHL